MILKLLIALLIGYLGWRWWKGLPRRSPARPFAPVFDEAEARAVLGVDADADAETIRAAHRRLMVALHPDRGGSTELARRINVARDTLLARGDCTLSSLTEWAKGLIQGDSESEERRGGKECGRTGRSQWGATTKKKNNKEKQ